MSKLHILAGFLVALLAIACPLPASTPIAEDLPLGEIDLGSEVAEISLNLSDASIRVTTDPTLPPRLRWWNTSPSNPDVVELASFQDGEKFVVERPEPPTQNVPVKLRLELTIASPAIRLSVTGHDLELTIENRVGSEENLSFQPPTNHTAAVESIQLQLDTSVLRLNSLHSVTGMVDDCLTELADTRGSIDLEATGGELIIERHRGTVKLAVRETNLSIVDLRGNLRIQANRGSVLLRSIQCPLNLKSNGAQIQIDRFDGTGAITAINSMIDFRESTSPRLSLNGAGSYLTLAEVAAPITFNLEAGSLSLDDCSGKFTGTCRESAELATTNHTGDVQITLTTSSRAELRRVHGTVTAQLTVADLTVDVVESLAFTAQDARVTASGVTELTGAQAIRSDVDLNLVELASNTVAINAGPGSSVWIQLATPCRVRTRGIDASTTDRIRVTGCESQFGQRGRWATRNVRGVDGNPPITLTATISSSANVDVEGRP